MRSISTHRTACTACRAPCGGGGIENSTLIDLDHEITQQDKTVYGDVELPIPGDVAPVPPPVG